MTNRSRGSGLELEQPLPRLQPLKYQVGAVSQRASLSVQQVQSAIRSVPYLQIYEEKFGDVDICRSLPISSDELEEMGISNLEHQDKIKQLIKQLINYESQNVLPLSEVYGRLCSDGVNGVESRSNLDMMSRSQSYSSMSCSNISSEVSEDVRYRKKTLIMTVHQERPVERWIIEKFWTKSIPALEGCVSISDHWRKTNAFIVTYQNEQTARERYEEGVRYKLTIQQQHLKAKEYKLMAKRKLVYTIAKNRGPRPCPKYHVRYRALCEQPVTAGKKKLKVVGVLKEGQVVWVNQEKIAKVRKVRIFDHLKGDDVGWVHLHSADGKAFLERLD